MTATTSTSGRIAGIVGGALLLVLLVGLAVLLPKVEEAPSDDAAAASEVTGEANLPDTLPGDLIAIDGDDLPAALAQQLADPAEVVQGQQEAADRVSTLFGADAAFRVYASSDASSIVSITVLDKAPGLFIPDGPPAEDSTAAASYQLVDVDGAVCAQYYSAPTDAQGQPAEGDPVLGRSHCQLGAGGRTYDLDAQGVSADDLAAVIDELASA